MTRDIFILSGGGARGAAQIGMLRALIGAGVVPDLIVGASVGALNSCFIASDPTPERVEELADAWMGMSQKSLIGPKHHAAYNLVRRRHYLFSCDRLRGLVADWMDADTVEDLAVPVRVATTDLATGRPVHHTSGDLGDVLAASAALPALFPPVLIDGRHHIDAGVSENLPVSGATDVAEPGDRVWLLDVTKTRTAHRGLHSPIHVLVAALAGSITNRPATAFAPGVELIDCKLDDDFENGSVFDFSHTGTLYRLGEQAVTARLVEMDARR
jgi:NTE family protein